MALIGCRYCGKQVSDKAMVCPHCGGRLVDENNINVKWKFCIECGTEIPLGAKTCPTCGWPIPEKDDNTTTGLSQNGIVSDEQKKETLKKIIIGAIIAIVVVLLGIVIINGKKKADAEKAAKEYIANVQDTAQLMILGAADAESAGNITKRVWYNSIYEKKDEETDKYTRKNNGTGEFYDDFNDALWNLWLDREYTSQIGMIKSNQESVMENMKELKNPPQEHDEAYDAMKDLYEAYMKLTNCAIDPTGSYTSYSESFNKADEEFMPAYNKVEMYFE